jgi:hypothetical protein
MHVVLVEPAFPKNQREFLRGLLSTGARVSAIGERPLEALPTSCARACSSSSACAASSTSTVSPRP